ncbi:enoyl-CoA hydratase/isomerase family protein [Desulfobacter hydrogenophilus]|nr:enoyl-CoA hydratase/isomerase family protein [Desulfobacter hydrogenophilus]NDY72794.1 enoyl-CoA hydratase/isomerase family protein [Desulfobacter hydrogenophilus]
MESQRVITSRNSQMLSITLNRPNVINSLDVEMIRLIQECLDEAESSPSVRLVLINGTGDKGFCAGGDVEAIYNAVKQGDPDRGMVFFREEYDLDLRIFKFPKPVIVLAHGITMGGGLGLAAGADMVVSTEKTVMAMPETRIGFFPDVGATGWLFSKCPAGYPEFIGLTGYRLKGPECRRLGLASHMVIDDMRLEFIKDLEQLSEKLPDDRSKAVQVLSSAFKSLRDNKYISNLEMDEWVRTCFAGKRSVNEILSLLSECSQHKELSQASLTKLSEKSPTSLALTLSLLRSNEKRAMEDVYRKDLKAVRFMITHPDYAEGVRAQLVDKDKNPVWQPGTIDETSLPGFL